jgi:hypothetical protein
MGRLAFHPSSKQSVETALIFRTAIPVASIPVRWRLLSLAETVASVGVSAGCYGRSEDIFVVAVVISELKFGDVQRQIFLADLVIGADNAALQDAPEAFNRVGVNGADDVFAASVADHLMGIQLLDVVVADPFVGNEQADLVRHSVHDEFGEHFAAHGIDDTRHDVALAADGADNRHLARTKATTTRLTTALPKVFILGFATDEGFVHLDHAAQFVEILFDQRRANAMAHIPSRLVGAEADIAMDLPRAHALLAGQQQMNDAIPSTQIDLGILENGPGNVGEPIAASAAIRAFPFEFHSLERVTPFPATARANHAVRPAPGDQVFVASPLIGECRLELGDGHLGYLLRLLTGHGGALYRQSRAYHV